MGSGYYSFIEGQIKKWGLRIGEYIRRGKRIVIQAYPGKTHTHAALLLASKMSDKTDNIVIELYKKRPARMEDSLSIMIGFEHVGGIESSIAINGGNSLYTTVYTALLVAEEFSVIKDYERIIALSSIYQEAGNIEENHPLLGDPRALGLLKIYRRFPAITGGYYKTMAEAMYQTLNPYYPSYTGRPLSIIKEKLEDLGIDPEKKIVDQGPEATGRLLEELLGDLRSYRGEAGKKDIIQVLVTAQVGGVPLELKELSEAIDIMLDLEPGVILDLYSRGDPRIILSSRIKSVGIVAEALRKLKDKKYDKRNSKITLKCPRDAPVGFIGDLARRAGLIGKQHSLICRDDEGGYTSIYEYKEYEGEEGPLIRLG